jgi:signal transduction histidine kinase
VSKNSTVGVRLWHRMLRRHGGTSLSQRFGWAAAAAAVVVTVTLGAISFLFSSAVLLDQAQQRLEYHANLNAQRVELSLNDLARQLTSLASSSLVTNALLDSQGRDIYLRPFLADQRNLAHGGDLILSDFSGTALVASHGHTASTPQFGSDERRQAVEQNADLARLSRNTGIGDGTYLLLGVPVIYPGTDMAEGFLELSVPLARMLTLESSPKDGWMLLSGGDQAIFGQPRQGQKLIQRPLHLESPLNRLGLSLTLSISFVTLLSPLGILLATYLVVGGAAAWYLAYLARPGAQSLAKPLSRLSDQADKIYSTGRLVLNPENEAGPEEIVRLSRALQRMMNRLRDSHNDLERRVEERTRELRLSEDLAQKQAIQLKTLFDLSPDGFVSFDLAGRMSFVNPAFERLTGLSGAELLGVAEQELQNSLRTLIRNPEQWQGFDNCVSDQPNQRIELIRPRKSVLEISCVTSHGNSLSRVIYLRDITHQVEIDRMKSEFLSVAAHELRTPLTSIFGFSEILLHNEVDDATRQDLLNTIHGQTSLLADIINELLDLARIEARRGRDFHIVDVDLHSLVEDTLAAFASDPARWPLIYSADPENAVGKVRGDVSKLRQALTNILGNASKYSPDGGRIEIDLVHRDQSPQRRIGVSIRDHGIGMTPEQVARIFERFYRADTSGKTPGSGLGMSIVKEIMDLHGGEVEVSSTPGQGTHIILWLPKHHGCEKQAHTD